MVKFSKYYGGHIFEFLNYWRIAKKVHTINSAASLKADSTFVLCFRKGIIFKSGQFHVCLRLRA